MVKLMGAVMTGFACAYFGFKLSLSLKKRIASLTDICTSLEMLESEISFTADKLKRAFLRVDRNGLFTSAAEEIEDKGIKKAWNNAVSKSQKRLCLTDADCNAVCMLGETIGKTDLDNQIKHIKYVKSAVMSQRDGAQAEYNRFGRVYRSGGVLIGLMIIIVLL